jgi:hypothetical protein
MSLTLGRFVEFPRAAPSGIPQTSLGFRGHLITNFQNIMVLLIIIDLMHNDVTRFDARGMLVLVVIAISIVAILNCLIFPGDDY